MEHLKPEARFGRLTVIGDAGYIERPKKHKKNDKVYIWKEPLYLCRCDCGNTFTAAHYHLVQGHTRSCGCLVEEHTRSLTKHGDKRSHFRSRLYIIWTDMLDRCRNSKFPSWKYYGGRGIQVCDEWASSYEAFKEWALSHGYREDLTIDRIDNDGNYTPENCRWATAGQQAKNKRSNKTYTVGGKTMIKADWARSIGAATSHTIESRLRRGWDLERACTTPSKERERFIEIDGVTKNITGWAKDIGISIPSLYQWMRNHGEDLEDAIRTLLGTYEKKRPRLIEIQGETLTIAGWSKRNGIPEWTIRDRLAAGWDEEEAVTTPVYRLENKSSDIGNPRKPRHNAKLYEFEGVGDTIAGWARRRGISVSTLDCRIRRGWSLEKALCEPIGKHSTEGIAPGTVFGNLTVLMEAEPQGQGRWYLCRCICGNEKVIPGKSLTSGNTKSCGCLGKRSPIETGTRFGRLVVIESVGGEGKAGGELYRCRCDCGNECIKPKNQLLQGGVKSCGCIRKEKEADLAPGTRFGHLTVIRRADDAIQKYTTKDGKEYSHKRQQYLCRCDCGNEKVIQRRVLVQGSAKSCGCGLGRRKKEEKDG